MAKCKFCDKNGELCIVLDGEVLCDDHARSFLRFLVKNLGLEEEVVNSAFGKFSMNFKPSAKKEIPSIPTILDMNDEDEEISSIYSFPTMKR